MAMFPSSFENELLGAEHGLLRELGRRLLEDAAQRALEREGRRHVLEPEGRHADDEVERRVDEVVRLVEHLGLERHLRAR